jgi:cobalt-zinc-cadmium efflux system outer membrane protein
MTMHVSASLRATGCAVAALIAAIGGQALADPAPSYDSLVGQSDTAPLNLEAAALAEAAEARVRQAGVRTNPELSLDIENALGSGPFTGYGAAETTLSVSQDLELFGRRRARIDVARAEAGVAGLRRDAAGVEAASRLALAYAEAEAAQRRFALTEEMLSITLADGRAALALVEEGREPLVRGLQAESEVAAARAAFDEAQAERDAAFARLTAVAMLVAPVTSIEDSLLDRAPSSSGVTAYETLGVQVAQAERDVAQERIDVERGRALPDVTASVGFRRFEAEDATALTFGVSVPLPLFDRNRGNIDAAHAEFRAAEARVDQARQEAVADRAAAMARLAGSASRVRAADGGVTAAEEAYRLTRIGFEAGRISQLELRASRSALIAARNAAIDARLARVRAEIDLARLDGRIPFGGSL